MAPIAFAAVANTNTDAQASGGGSASAESSSDATNSGTASADSTATGTNGGDAEAISVSIAADGANAESTTYATAKEDGTATSVAVSVAVGSGAEATSEADTNAVGEGSVAVAGSVSIAIGKKAHADSGAEADADCQDDCYAGAAADAVAIGKNADADAHADAIANDEDSYAGAGATAWAIGEGTEADANAESKANKGGSAESSSWAWAYDEYGTADSATKATATGDNAYAMSIAMTCAGEDSIAQAYMNTDADATHSAGAYTYGVITAHADPSGANTHADTWQIAMTDSALAVATSDITASSFTSAGGIPAAGIVIKEADVSAKGHDSVAGQTIDADASTSHHAPDEVNIYVESFVSGIGHATETVYGCAKHIYLMVGP
ncbi:MAG: hypothetical protein Q7T55_26470, partial [Solirubrobacteraceae bacterium]|nr:hypothetical protein [Solirubrobacteraceae bacterium]